MIAFLRSNPWAWIVLGVLVGYTVRYFYLKPMYTTGEVIQDFTATNITGEKIQLSQFIGSYVLLDFWASWCGPCREDNPRLVQLYNETRGHQYVDGDSLVMISVALEMKPQPWKKAIERDGLSWPYHIAEFEQFSSPIAKMYGVREIPTKYLIDPKGHIIMVNPDVEKIKKYLDARKK
jgi:thiol-disulfide isomerase/thioredoxin